MIKKKIVLIRLDKIGDLICTLPVDQVLDNTQYEILWVIQKGLGPLVDLGTKKRNYIELDKADPKKSAELLKQTLTQFKPDIAISFQAPWWVNFELFKQQIPLRAGVKSQWHSFLFLNKALRQKRSFAEKHEFDYNLEIVLNSLDIKQTKEFLKFEIQQPTQLNTLKEYNLESKKYIVVHPGMMGSALNWSQKKYIEYIARQILKNKTVVITGTPADEPYLTEIKLVYETHPQIRWLQSKLNLKQLVEILSQAEFVVAPSTGVAHIAASLGAEVHALFSPIRVHHPRRWAPRGNNVHIHLPPEEFHDDFNCMEQITL